LAPISSAVRRWMPGSCRRLPARPLKGELHLDLVGEQLDLLIEEVEMGKDRGRD
jgi:hypothetical protein